MARRQRRDKQKTLAKAALFCCLHQAQAAVNVTVGKNLFFVSAHLPGAMDHRAGSGNQFAKRMCIFQRTAHPSEIIIDVSAGSTRQCANVKAAGEQVIDNIFTDKPGSARHRDSLIHARDSCT